ncbi:hypothetical protein CCACVL1_19060 [Corchorus capsularis]|uniref:Uncharacterized protein n=1 Tax=Corchorus capsularis TaxID=210143 RepID=A0A1R3HIS8_COCAP|nr:hypothetical protein CCACVL1_19060 [Corchorus capsularis]
MDNNVGSSSNEAQSMPPVALGAAVSEIASVVIMTYSIAKSAPGNRSRAAIGADLVSMTKCHLRARKFITKDGMNGTRMRPWNFSVAEIIAVTLGFGRTHDELNQRTQI